MIRYSQIPSMSLRDLCNMAQQLDKAKRGSRKASQLTNRMGAVSFYLEDSGALAQLLWWAREVEAEAPPDEKAEVLSFSSLSVDRTGWCGHADSGLTGFAKVLSMKERADDRLAR